jgi:hypothetical protein
MWFRLKKNYSTHDDEIHRYSWGVLVIRKGAPIDVVLRYIDGAMKPEFIFCFGGLKHINLSILETPSFCAVTQDNEVFCVTKNEFFFPGNSCWARLQYCPLCGKKLEILPPCPSFEMKKFILEVGD